MTTYSWFQHFTLPDGRVETVVTDNDDDDDGFPDEEVQHYTLGPRAKELALQPPMNESHMGCCGREVKVWLDGIELKEGHKHGQKEESRTNDSR